MGAQSGTPGMVTPSAYDPLPGIPPNMTTNAAISAGLLPTNVLLTNALLGKTPAGARPPVEAMSRAGEVGTAGTVGGAGGAAFHPMSNSANGGSGPGPVNQDLGASSGRSDTLDGAMPSTVIAVGSPPQFCG